MDISAGTEHNLALSEDLKLYAWGSGMMGELGLGTEGKAIGNFESAQLVPTEDKITQISAGASHSTALTGSGRLLVWGSNR